MKNRLQSPNSAMLMRTTVYLIRHAQSRPTLETHHSQLPLSDLGQQQAISLVSLLESLDIAKLYSSPYLRCLDTIGPFADRSRLDVVIDHDLRERLVSECLIPDFEQVWARSWTDFDFRLPGCESSSAAQERFCKAVRRIVAENPGATIAISSHGNVIGLLLNHLDNSCAREQAERLMNPDVIRLVATETTLSWDRDFRLPGLRDIATTWQIIPIE
jgi:2,3-bisphosphoglycerate-dependent phosphoglycerate mutase